MVCKWAVVLTNCISVLLFCVLNHYMPSNNDSTYNYSYHNHNYKTFS